MLLREKLKRLRGRDSDSDSDEGTDDVVQPAINMKFKKLRLFILMKSILSLEAPSLLPSYHLRACNVKRDRIGILRWARELDDKMFRRQSRLVREDFCYVLLKMG